MPDVLYFPASVVPPCTVVLSGALPPDSMPPESVGFEVRDGRGVVLVASWIHPTVDRQHTLNAAWDFADELSREFISARQKPGA